VSRRVCHCSLRRQTSKVSANRPGQLPLQSRRPANVLGPSRPPQSRGVCHRSLPGRTPISATLPGQLPLQSRQPITRKEAARTPPTQKREREGHAIPPAEASASAQRTNSHPISVLKDRFCSAIKQQQHFPKDQEPIPNSNKFDRNLEDGEVEFHKSTLWRVNQRLQGSRMVGRRLRSQKQQVKPHTSHQVEIRPTPSGSGSQCERVKTTRWSPRAKQVESQSGKKKPSPKVSHQRSSPIGYLPLRKTPSRPQSVPTQERSPQESASQKEASSL